MIWPTECDTQGVENKVYGTQTMSALGVMQMKAMRGTSPVPFKSAGHLLKVHCFPFFSVLQVGAVGSRSKSPP